MADNWKTRKEEEKGGEGVAAAVFRHERWQRRDLTYRATVLPRHNRPDLPLLSRFLFSLSRQGPSRIGREIKYEISSRIVFPFFVEFNLTATVKQSRIEKWEEGTRLDLEKKFRAASPGIVSGRMWKWNF